ncbi:hypothetical protein MD484_g5372, partial [Candolleomyces efflorescens]
MDSDCPQHLAHLFTSNIAPQPLEIVSIKQKIERSTNMIEQLQQRLEKLERRRQGYQALLSPVRRVPAEVLGEIFACVLEVEKSQKQQPQSFSNWYSAEDSLISLILVCSAWHDAAISLPRLWTHVEVCSVPYRLQLDGASRRLDRCRGIPDKTLTIYGDYRCMTSNNCAKEACVFSDPGLARLLTDGPLFDKLVLCCKGTQCLKALMAGMDSIKTETRPRPWDSMKSLDLYVTHRWDETDPSKSLFRHVPPVTSFLLHLPDTKFLSDDPSELDHALLHLEPLERTLANLTTFTLVCNWDGTMILEVLQMCCHNLEDLTLDFQSWMLPYRDAPSLAQISQDELLFPKLRVLRIRHSSGDSVDIVQFFRTPVLAELDVSLADFDLDVSNFIRMRGAPKEFHTVILSLLDRSRCHRSLRKFRLHSVDMTKEEHQLEKTLVNLPYLTHLILDNVNFDPYDLDEDFHEQRETFIPHLEVLELLHLVPHFPLDALGNVVKRRQTPGNSPGTLRKFIATFQRHIPPDFDYFDQLFGDPSTVPLMAERSFGFA